MLIVKAAHLGFLQILQEPMTLDMNQMYAHNFVVLGFVLFILEVLELLPWLPPPQKKKKKKRKINK